jgi:hypothetical protein
MPSNRDNGGGFGRAASLASREVDCPAGEHGRLIQKSGLLRNYMSRRNKPLFLEEPTYLDCAKRSVNVKVPKVVRQLGPASVSAGARL